MSIDAIPEIRTRPLPSRYSVTTRAVRREQEKLAVYVYGHFRRKLSFEEAYDCAAEALIEAERYERSGKRIDDLRRWTRRAAWRNALDVIRKVEGEGREKRQRPAGISSLESAIVDPGPGPLDEVSAAPLAQDADALAVAFARLRPEEQRVLHLRYRDELGADDVMAVLDLTRHQYENLHKRGMRKLRDALVAAEAHDGCEDCKTLVLEAAATALTPVLVAQRDAHLAGCLTCRAFAAREAGLIAALPLPALASSDRFVSRIHSFFAGAPDPTQHIEAVAGAAAAGTGTAAAAGSGATLFGAVGGAKTLAVICSAAAATTTVCVTDPLKSDPPKKERQAERAAKAKSAKRVVAKPATATSAVAPTVSAATTTPKLTSKPIVDRAAQLREEAAAERRRKRARVEKAKRDASPFLPESADTPTQASSAPTATATAASTSSGGAPSAPAASTTTKTTSADFSTEFTP